MTRCLLLISSFLISWDNEFVKWLGPGVVKTLALAESDRKTVEKNIDCFVKTKMFNVLIASYETIRTHVKRLTKFKDCCDLMVCDEAHRLKNRDNQTSMALNSIPVKKRVLLTGTPMQNDLEEVSVNYFKMFCRYNHFMLELYTQPFNCSLFYISSLQWLTLQILGVSGLTIAQ